MSPALPERKYHHGNLREALVKTAMLLLRRREIADLTLRDVAKSAGVAQSAMYRHFASKGALLSAIAERGFKELMRRAEAQISRHSGNPRTLYHSVASTYVKFALDNPQLYKLMFLEEAIEVNPKPGTQSSSNASFAQLVGVIEQCQTAGLIATAQDKTTAALALWSLLHGLSSLLRTQRLSQMAKKRKETLAKALARMLLSGLRAH